MTHTLVTVLALALLLSDNALAQEALSQAKALYNNAAYEDALNLLEQSAGKETNPAVHQYRAFCLMALGRMDDADRAIAVVVATDPFFTPDTREIAPRLVGKFNETRRKILRRSSPGRSWKRARCFKAANAHKPAGVFTMYAGCSKMRHSPRTRGSRT